MTTMTLAEISKSLREDAAWWREKKPEIIQARKLDIFADAIDAHLAKGAQVPDQPDKALLISMACRHRHDFGLLDRRAQESIIHSMHQLWEEVSGRGFYDETKRESYLAMLSQRGEVES